MTGDETLDSALSDAVVEETRWLVEFEHQRVRDIEAKGVWAAGFAGVTLALFLAAIPDLLTDKALAGHDCWQTVVGIVAIIGIVAGAAAGTLGITAAQVFRYRTSDIGSLLKLADEARTLGDGGRAAFTANLPGAHAQSVRDLHKRAESKADVVRWATGLLMVPLGCAAVLVTIYVVALLVD